MAKEPEPKIKITVYKGEKPTNETIEVANTLELLENALYGHDPKDEKDEPEEF